LRGAEREGQRDARRRRRVCCDEKLTGNDDRGASLERAKVVLEPSDVDNIQVVGGLIEEEDIGLEEDGASEGELHLPSSGEGSDGGLLALGGEADGLEDGAALGLGLEDTLVLDDERDDGVLGLVSVDIVLDVEGADLVGRRESLNLSVVDSPLRRRKKRKSASDLQREQSEEKRRTMRVDFPDPLRPQSP